MEHVLDNPAWNALISGNQNLAQGNNQVKYFDQIVGPFAGMQNNSAEEFEQLYQLLPDGRPAVIVNSKEIEIPENWKSLHTMRGFQMVFEREGSIDITANLVHLNDEHIPQILELTKLTNPGPFAERTIDFGHYYGVFDGDKLVAMAGQRMHVYEYAEISAVCTHPDYTGRGYARQLLQFQADRIKAAGGIPILHVRGDNKRAIKVYEDLGFVARRKINFFVIQKM